MGKKLSALKYFYYGIQMVFMTVLPFVLCIYGASRLKEKFSLGGWVMIVGILLALVIAAADIFSFGKMLWNDMKKDSGRERR